MNKQLSPGELADLSPTILPMTRREKLLRFAEIVRAASKDFLIFSNLERYTPLQLANASDHRSAFAAAAADNILKDAGLTGQTAADAMKFFELDQTELHAFSCDCGGAISNTDMAYRIETLAQR